MESPLVGGRFRFRGGENGLPLTERLMMQYANGEEMETSFVDSEADHSFESYDTGTEQDARDLFSF